MLNTTKTAGKQHSSVRSPFRLNPMQAARMKKTISNFGWRMVIIGVVLFIWEMIVQMKLVNSFLLGSPLEIFDSAMFLAKSGDLWIDIYATVRATVIGFLVGSFLGSLCGLALWFSKRVAQIIDPFIVALNGVPKLALAPLIIIWFGSGLTSKIILATVATFIVALLSAYQATLGIDSSQINLMKSFGAKKHQIFTKIIVPASLPWIISAFRINIGLALVSVVGGEFISSDKGLGHMIFVQGNLFNLPAVWVGIFTLMLVAIFLYTCVGILERRLLSWNEGADSAPRTNGV